MIIKKYTGKTEDEAVLLAKKELGNGIVIMNVKNVKKKGIFRFFKPQLVEVTVALEEEHEKASFVKREQKAVQEEKAQETFEAVQVMAQAQKPVEEIGQKLDSLQSLLEKQIQSKTDEAKKTEEESKEEEKTSRFLKLLYSTLLESEVKETYADQILDGVEKNVKSNTTIDYLLSNIYQKTILKFGQPARITKAGKNPKVVFFIGPTGVGKTTTIAKIASKFCVEDKSRIALLTTDTYRIAAAEQLRTYANILEVPLRVIYTTEEFHTALEDFKDYDYIFVDTSGHSYKNEEQKNATLGYLNCVDEELEKEVYLVISATTKYKDLEKITEAYAEVEDYRLIFTKLDETTTLGNLLNIRLHTGAQMSYVTYGQNVPDDIEEFNPQHTVRLLLGGKNA